MNNYCWFCGSKINSNDKKCSVCDADIFTNRVNVEEKRKEYAEIRKKYDIQILAELIMLYDERYANKEKKVPVEYIYNELHDGLAYNSREKKKIITEALNIVNEQNR